jgi:hypothetical protein
MSRRFFSDRVRQGFRGMSAANLPDTCTRYIATDTYGDGAAVTTTYVADYQSPCRLEPVTVTEGVSEDALLAQGEYELALPVSRLILARDRFVVTGTALDDSAWNRVVEVVGTPGPHTWESERVVRMTARVQATVQYTLSLSSTMTPTGSAT